MPITRLAALSLAFLIVPVLGYAQEEEPPAEDPPAEAVVVAPEAAPMRPRSPTELQRPRPPPPVMVVVLPARRVDEAVLAAVSEAVVTQIREWTGRRPVHALGAEEILTAVANCQNDECHGGLLATAGAQMGVIVRLQRRGRELEATIEMRDPVSGLSRQDPVQGRFAPDAAAVPEGLAPLIAQLEPAMPTRPGPPPTLLVTVNEDGAAVSIDGINIGLSPVAPEEIIEGPHEIAIIRNGFVSQRRTIDVSPGQQARVDVTLVEVGAAGASMGSGGGNAGSDGNPWQIDDGDEAPLIEQWWFWTIIGGAAILIGVAIGVGVFVASQPGEPLVPVGVRLPPIVTM